VIFIAASLLRMGRAPSNYHGIADGKGIMARRGRRRMAMRRWAAALVTGAMVNAVPGAAQQANSPPNFLGPPTMAPLALPRPADTGKPALLELPSVPAAPAGRLQDCTVAVVCDLSLIGELRHDGAVELKGTVLKW
jgi:hypothetical protein